MYLGRHIAARSSWIVVAALSLASLGCTAGLVTKNGSPVAGAEVHIWTCDDLGGFQTTTDASGTYRFNPFDPSSPAFDATQFVPPGPIAIIVTGGAGSMVVRRDHQYDETCPIRYNGSTQNLPCKLENVDLVPMGLPEFLAESADFLSEDCGVESKLANRLAGAAIPREMQRIRDLSARPTPAGCITRCAQGCSGQPMADFAPCMCICVEGSCGTSFGPFCTETTP